MTDKNLLRIGFFGVFLGCLISFSACGSDSSSSADGDFFSSGSQEGSSASDSTGVNGSGSSMGSADSNSPSAQDNKSETISSNEVLNPAQKKVNGTCAPTTPKIKKGEIATWKFYRNAGSIYEQVVAPFKWAFTGAKTTALQGNGDMDEVNVRYEASGTATATLNVDGNEIKCDPLQVQGVPITIKSCEASAATVKAGLPISWTVVAESESKITAYSWSSDFGTVSGNGTSASLTTTAAMHKKNVTAVVAVTNADKTTETYTCDGATVLDPEAVDMVLTIGDMNGDSKYSEPNRTSLPDNMFIPGGTPIVVQVPTTAKSGCIIMCNPRVGSDYNSMKVTWDGTELSSFAYLDPNTTGCAPGKKYSVESNVTALCLVNP